VRRPLKVNRLDKNRIGASSTANIVLEALAAAKFVNASRLVILAHQILEVRAKGSSIG
jgi:hypothetical protein